MKKTFDTINQQSKKDRMLHADRHSMRIAFEMVVLPEGCFYYYLAQVSPKAFVKTNY